MLGRRLSLHLSQASQASLDGAAVTIRYFGAVLFTIQFSLLLDLREFQFFTACIKHLLLFYFAFA